MQISTALSGRRFGGHLQINRVVNSVPRSVGPVRSITSSVKALPPVVGFVATHQATDQELELLESDTVVLSLKDMVEQTEAYRQFQQKIENKPALLSDWLSFTSRPWVQGPVDAFLGNTQLAAMMYQHKDLAATVHGLVDTLDTTLMQGGHVPWLLHVVQHVAGHSGMYVIMQAVEEMLGPHHIARLERLTYAALTRPRAVKLMAVLVALLTPQVVEGLLQLARTIFTDERLTRLMDAAEYVVSEDDRMALAALALDSLSDSVDDDAILHLIATMDTEADVALLVQTGQELLEWLLQENDPVVMGKQLGSLLDAVADVDRLQRTVQRNDEVMTLERIAVLHKVLAQISPAGSPQNVTAAVSALRAGLKAHKPQAWLSAASAELSAADLRRWWIAFDQALLTRHIEAVLDSVEALLDGGRIWALLGQPQPALEMLLMADEEARAATCRSRCGIGSSEDDLQAEQPQHSMGLATARKQGAKQPGKLALASRDEWTLHSLASMDDAGTAHSTAHSSNGGTLAGAAAAAAAAANAAAEAAAVAPSCALDDKDCQECSGRCGSPVERAFASGAQLSDPDIAALIRGCLREIRPHRLVRQRAAAQATAQHAFDSAAAAAMSGDGSGSSYSPGGSFDFLSGSSISSTSSILASIDMAGSPLSGSLHLASAAMPGIIHRPAGGGGGECAQQNASSAAAAAVAVAAAAVASQGSTCSFAAAPPPSRDLTAPDVLLGLSSAAAKAGSSKHHLAAQAGGSSSHNSRTTATITTPPEQEEHRCARVAVSSAAQVANAVFKPQRLRSFLDLLPELLAPQRLAIAMAVLDNVLRIGEHNVAVGPVCDISTPASNASSNINSNGTGSGSGRGSSTFAWFVVVLPGVLAVLTAVPGVVSKRLMDAAVAAAAELAAGPSSRRLLLHAVDTLLALASVQQELQVQQQEQQHQGRQHEAVGSGAAAAAGRGGVTTQKPLQQAAAVVHCALGDPHSCVTAEELLAEAGPGSCSSSSNSFRSGNNRAQLLATVLGLHVSLAKDMWALWWGYHTRLVLNLGGNSRV